MQLMLIDVEALQLPRVSRSCIFLGAINRHRKDYNRTFGFAVTGYFFAVTGFIGFAVTGCFFAITGFSLVVLSVRWRLAMAVFACTVLLILVVGYRVSRRLEATEAAHPKPAEGPSSPAPPKQQAQAG